MVVEINRQQPTAPRGNRSSDDDDDDDDWNETMVNCEGVLGWFFFICLRVRRCESRCAMCLL